MQQPAAFARRQHRDSVRLAGGAEVRAFERVHRDVHGGKGARFLSLRRTNLFSNE